MKSNKHRSILPSEINNGGLLPSEIVVDNFAGGGGASTGIKAGLGRDVDIAINHNEKALAIHRVNHPNTLHLCESVWSVNPIEVTKNQPVGLVWLSPDCTHFSRAKGGKPISKKIRGLAWVGLRWALKCKPRVLILENVEEFMQWGPLLETTKGKFLPCQERKGEIFKGFILALSTGLPAGSLAFKDMHAELFKYNYDINEKLAMYKQIKRGLGYQVETNLMRGCDYGAPTTRKRFFMVARRDGIPIAWPKKTHGHASSLGVKKKKLKPYLKASDCIDWNIEAASVFTRKKPLVEKSRERVRLGIEKFIINNTKPFIIERSTGKGGEKLLTSAFIAKNYTGVVGSSVEEPVHTITAVDHNSLVTVTLKQYDKSVGRTETAYSMSSVAGKKYFDLVMVDGEAYEIIDVGFRMLQPRELFTAQGFSTDYIIDEGVGENGEGVTLNKSEKTRMVGNSVCPSIAEALVRANFAHEKTYQMVS